MTPVRELKYTEAVGELEAIIRKMQAPDADIDSLTTLTRRATELIAECRARLTATDSELQQILSSLQ